MRGVADAGGFGLEVAMASQRMAGADVLVMHGLRTTSDRIRMHLGRGSPISAPGGGGTGLLLHARDQQARRNPLREWPARHDQALRESSTDARMTMSACPLCEADISSPDTYGQRRTDSDTGRQGSSRAGCLHAIPHECRAQSRSWRATTAGSRATPRRCSRSWSHQ